MQLLIATRNPHKFDEIRAILAVPGLTLLSLDGIPGVPEVVEDQDTLEGNARKKAATVARASGSWALADDSGLEVDALGSAPGVYSARYAGEEVSYEQNNRKLLRELIEQPNRSACFRCVISLSDPDGCCETVEGRCRGRIVEAPRGRHGFGYDPVFQPEGYSRTFAELSPDAKNRISHRRLALEAAREAWQVLFGATAERFPRPGPPGAARA